MSDPQSTSRKWLGWFRPLGRGWREGSLVAVPIEIREGKILSAPLVITVPSSCGCAVRRNRFRRMTKAYFEKRLAEAARNNLGSSRKDPRLTGGQESVQPKNDLVPVRALWIRLLNRHRLDRKIRLEDWERYFETLAAKALS